MDKLIAKYNLEEIKKINKGMSADTKYEVKDNAGGHYLLRVADINEYKIKKHEYDLIEMWNKCDIPMPKAVDFGTCNEEKNVYMLIEWMEGVEVQSILSSLSPMERYGLGKKSGEILRKIHTIPVPADSTEWSKHYFTIINERIKAFKCENVNFTGYNIILDYLKQNKELLTNRPQCYHHGDYHTGNMIYSPNGDLCIIDWHTVDFENYGDPWYEFNRIGVECPEFATGQIDGYFEENVPEEFWKLFAFYLSASAITSVVWAKYWAPEEYKNIIKLNQDILKWFDNMNSVKPKWYLTTIKSVSLR